MEVMRQIFPRLGSIRLIAACAASALGIGSALVSALLVTGLDGWVWIALAFASSLAFFAAFLLSTKRSSNFNGMGTAVAAAVVNVAILLTLLVLR